MFVSFHISIQRKGFWFVKVKESYMSCILEDYNVPKTDKELLLLEEELKQKVIGNYKDDKKRNTILSDKKTTINLCIISMNP